MPPCLQEDLRGEAGELRERLLAAETARDSVRLRLRAMRQVAGANPLHTAEALPPVGESEGGAAPDAEHVIPAASNGGDSMAAAEGASDGGAGAACGSSEDGAGLQQASRAGSGGAPAEPPDAGAAAAAEAAATEDDGEADTDADVDVVAELRAQICSLESQLRQARTLQRAQSTMLRSGTTDGVTMAAAAAAVAVGAGAGSRCGGRGGTSGGGAPVTAASSRYASMAGTALVIDPEGGSSMPLTPAHRPMAEALTVPLEVRLLCAAEAEWEQSPSAPQAQANNSAAILWAATCLLGKRCLPARTWNVAQHAYHHHPAPPALIYAHLQEADSSKDAELIAGTTAHFVSQEQLKHRLAAIGRQMVAKQRRLAALQGAVATGDGLKAQYDGHLQVGLLGSAAREHTHMHTRGRAWTRRMRTRGCTHIYAHTYTYTHTHTHTHTLDTRRLTHARQDMTLST